jgi:ferredoxin
VHVEGVRQIIGENRDLSRGRLGKRRIRMAREAYVDQDSCIGCELCTTIVPAVFRLNDDGVSEVYDPAGADEDKIQEAIDSCPVSCIHWR